LLSGGVALLFLVLCANVGSLLLAGLTARRREISTRVALGASRWRLARQALIEGALTGAGGLAAGIALGWLLVSIARSVLPALHSLNPLNLDVRALVVTSAAGLIATLASGILPALVGTRVDVARSLNLSGRTGTETARARIATRILLTSQIALSCVLLIGATGLVRSFINLMTADRGINTSNILVAWVAMTDPSLRSPDARQAAARAIEDQTRALPGVTHAAWSYGTPPRGAIGLGGNWTPDGGSRVSLQVSQSVVGAEFFDLYGIRILRGRSFEPSDAPDAILVSERLATALGRMQTHSADRSASTTRKPARGLIPCFESSASSRTRDSPRSRATRTFRSSTRSTGARSTRRCSAFGAAAPVPRPVW
jgi:hypothetical protein